MAYGSLHFITFDGSEYTFKGLGEFVIVRLSSSTGSNIFTLQGETAPLVTGAQPKRVPALVRLAAFYQGVGKVSLTFHTDILCKNHYVIILMISAKGGVALC